MSGAPGPPPHPYTRPPRPGAVPLLGPAELARLLAGGVPPLLVDVRPAGERRFARLPGDRSVPLDRLAAAAAALPRDRPIVTYDHLGFGARRAADLLLGAGFPRVAALEGGLDEYARLVDPTVPRYPPDARTPGFVLRQMPRPGTGCLSYLLGDADAREAVVVDPGIDPAPYLAALHGEGWRLVAVVETHTHADHLAGHAPLHAATDATIWTSHRAPAAYPHRRLTDGEAIRFGREELVALETPGHTPDHLSLRVRDKVLTGDTLLLGSCGRTDLGGGSPERLYESLTDRLLRLPDPTEVYPAHYGPRHALPDRYVSTIGFERRTNEALLQPTREEFLRYMAEGWGPKPTDFDTIVAANLAR